MGIFRQTALPLIDALLAPIVLQKDTTFLMKLSLSCGRRIGTDNHSTGDQPGSGMIALLYF
jgi:hypothetical protein